MRKKLVAVGNSVGLVIDKPILELLQIARDSEVELRTDGERLIVEPVREDRKKRIEAANKRVMKGHDETLRKLAK